MSLHEPRAVPGQQPPTKESGLAGAERTAAAKGRRISGAFSEAGAWRAVCKGWRPLFGGMSERGFSVEWHDFTCPAPLDWARSFHPDSLELCLNLVGSGRLGLGGREVEFRPQTWGFYYRGAEAPVAWRLPRERHQFITVEFAREFLRRHLNGQESGLHPLIRGILKAERAPSALSDVSALRAHQTRWVMLLRQPPVAHAAQALWYEGKVLALLAEFFFQPSPEEEFFCDRQKRLARERVERAIAVLRENLAEPPDLEGLGKRVGCSPFYLSRTFSAEMGLTIPQYLRQLRLERAAELLRSGRFNVTEAALEVGYSSLSHFSQAFHETFGCCPGLYPLATPSQRLAAEKRENPVQ